MEVILQGFNLIFLRDIRTSFNPCFNGSYSSGSKNYCTDYIKMSFNPCFNGSYSSGFSWCYPLKCYSGFNPCFNGSYSSGRTQIETVSHVTEVSILVLMEVILQAQNLIL